MSALPLPLLVLGWSMTLIVAMLGWMFWRDPARGMAFATHDAAELPRVMVNRYFVIFMFLAGALVSGDARWIAYAFAVNAVAPLWDGLIYHRAGKPWQKHLSPAAMNMIVAIWALTLINKTGAA